VLDLRLKKVSLGYGDQLVLEGIELEAKPGEILGVIGPNGCGKSTLIRGISRIITPSSGRIFIDGQNIDGMSRSNLARMVAVVPQNPLLPESFTAFELVLMGRTPHLGRFSYEGEKEFVRG